MADKKISEFALATVLAPVDTVPLIQTQTNKQMTIGQLRSFVYTPTVSTVVAGIIPQTSNLVKVSGVCTLAAGTVEGVILTIVSTGAGKVVSTGLLTQDGFTFGSAGATLVVIWANGIWNLISSIGMTFGVV